MVTSTVILLYMFFLYQAKKARVLKNRRKNREKKIEPVASKVEDIPFVVVGLRRMDG